MEHTMPCDEERVDVQHIRGQEHAKRALEVAAAGGHHALLVGPPSAGKTLLARAVTGLLPSLPPDERAGGAAELNVEDGQGDQTQPRRPPCAAPRRDSSVTSLFGGGAGRVRPGAVSMAHRGVLLLDDLPAFSSRLERLRQILDDRSVTLERAGGPVTLPAAFQLVATARPCPCGWFGDPEHACRCTPTLVRRYQRRVPEALRDRIEIHIEVSRVRYEQLVSGRLSEPSAAVRERVSAARQRQANRFTASPGCTTNAEMGLEEIRAFCVLDAAGHTLIKAAVRQLELPPLAYHRTLRLARTIADLAYAELIGPAHLAEALQYRARPLL